MDGFSDRQRHSPGSLTIRRLEIEMKRAHRYPSGLPGKASIFMALGLVAGSCRLIPPSPTPTPISSTRPLASSAAPTSTGTPSPIGTPTEASTPTATVTASASETGAHVRQLWCCRTEGDQRVLWILQGDEIREILLPFWPGYVYDVSPSTDRVLFSADFFVQDLRILDLSNGSVEVLVRPPLIESAVATNARWLPNGHDVVYLAGTDRANLDLHWRSESGEDRVLAKYVSHDWSISPTGEVVAFARGSRDVPPGVEPGLFVVNVAGGEEVKLSDVDLSLAGTQSFYDRPYWSRDGERIVLLVYDLEASPYLLLRTDGSGEMGLSIEDDDASHPNLWTPTEILWHPDGQQLLISADVPYANSEGGRSGLFLAHLDEGDPSLVWSATLAWDVRLIGWDVPGKSIWVVGRRQDNQGQVHYFPSRVALP